LVVEFVTAGFMVTEFSNRFMAFSGRIYELEAETEFSNRFMAFSGRIYELEAETEFSNRFMGFSGRMYGLEGAHTPWLAHSTHPTFAEINLIIVECLRVNVPLKLLTTFIDQGLGGTQ
jgi:hypothetical protein